MSWLFELKNEEDFAGWAMIVIGIIGSVYFGLISFGVIEVPQEGWWPTIEYLAPAAFVCALITIVMIILITWDEKRKK